MAPTAASFVYPSSISSQVNIARGALQLCTPPNKALTALGYAECELLNCWGEAPFLATKDYRWMHLAAWLLYRHLRRCRSGARLSIKDHVSALLGCCVINKCHAVPWWATSVSGMLEMRLSAITARLRL